MQPRPSLLILPDHSGGRCYVGGGSPNINLLGQPPDDGTVIGLNDWPYDMDYWLGCDVQNYLEYRPKALLKFMPHVPEVEHNKADVWFDLTGPSEPTDLTWKGRLQYAYTSALCAVHLALLMGHTTIVLWGVDMLGNEKFTGHVYEGSWDNVVYPFSVYLNKLVDAFGADVYKTNKASLLNVPYLESPNG